MIKLLKGCIFLVILAIGAFIGLIIYINVQSAPDKVIAGSNVPQHITEEINKLQLLNHDEKIVYFYSQGLLDIKEGFTFVTETNLVLYSKEWSSPAKVIPLAKISAIAPTYINNRIEDSTIVITLNDGASTRFPLSSQDGGDVKFVDYLTQSCPNLAPETTE